MYLFRMAQTDTRLLVLGALAGAAGVSLAVIWYRSRQQSHIRSPPTPHLSSNAQWVSLGRGPPVELKLDRQQEIQEHLCALVQCVSELKEEVLALKKALPQLQDLVQDELRGHRSVSGPRTPRRRRVPGSSRGERESSEEGESEGGYVTAHTDTEDDEEVPARAGGVADKLSLLLKRVDGLHKGSDAEKKEGFRALEDMKDEFGGNEQFLWRLARAYKDCHDMATSLEDKKVYAEAGKSIGSEAVAVTPTSAECHQWYAIMCGLMSDYESVQNRIKNGYLFKDHLDKAIELNPEDPLSYYLLGRWCYAVAQLSWIERKIAATLFGEPPSATVHDALRNFLKVEEIQPKYSKFNYVFIAKCYKDLGQMQEARRMCEAASALRILSKEDEEAQTMLESLHSSISF
ncbi:regulator of microtubule dynamics protein 2 isoform X2 [Brienomyrus brachyistius]|uniref:regulator of microtubule dynamics protein 2 isoform X2 n=1 Tax=Brienomyrus brachyistius TaxID=42636 RepID=UPI0020B41BBE|nr:regulator of microtubule dynamics protein 2 isoform X2 [Brienomyrus brachyistius]